MSEQNPKTRKESMQKLYATALSCKHEFQVSYFRYTVIAVGHWSVWDICCTGRGTASIFQAEKEATWAIGRVCRWVFGTAVVSRLAVGCVCILHVIATTAKQLSPSELQPCLGVPSQETQGHEVPPIGIGLRWGWTTLLLIQYKNKPWSCLQSSIEVTFMKVIDCISIMSHLLQLITLDWEVKSWLKSQTQGPRDSVFVCLCVNTLVSAWVLCVCAYVMG